MSNLRGDYFTENTKRGEKKTLKSGKETLWNNDQFWVVLCIRSFTNDQLQGGWQVRHHKKIKRKG